MNNYINTFNSFFNHRFITNVSFYFLNFIIHVGIVKFN